MWHCVMILCSYTYIFTTLIYPLHSESSMFITNNRLIVKTCGQTTLLLALKPIVQLVYDMCQLKLQVSLMLSVQIFILFTWLHVHIQMLCTDIRYYYLSAHIISISFFENAFFLWNTLLKDFCPQGKCCWLIYYFTEVDIVTKHFVNVYQNNKIQFSCYFYCKRIKSDMVQ